jgi:hypothetical protein
MIRGDKSIKEEKNARFEARINKTREKMHHTEEKSIKGGKNCTIRSEN